MRIRIRHDARVAGKVLASEVARREMEFHDALAAPLRAASMPPRTLDHLEAALMAKLGPVDGLAVAELGCGTGDLTLELMRCGAVVTALDLSPRMVEVARHRAALFYPNASPTFFAAPVEDTGLDAGSFDLVVGKWILHHADIRRGANEIHRLLRPGGRGVFIENSALNPALSFARTYIAGRFGIPRYGTEDEHPLQSRDYHYYRLLFREVRLDFPDFCFFTLLDRQLLKFRHPILSRALRHADEFTWEKMPMLRRYSYHVLLEIRA